LVWRDSNWNDAFVNCAFERCRDSLIMSPYELDENVPIGVLLV
jgi:hypothetical protein